MEFNINDYKIEKLVPQLTEKEKNYAALIALAGWAGVPILLQQVSRGSLKIFSFVEEFLKSFTDDEIDACFDPTKEHDEVLYDSFVYCLNILRNFGNYAGYGNNKIFPACDSDDFRDICKKKSWKLTRLFDACIDEMYDDFDNICNLGFYPKGCSAYYYPDDFTQEEAEGIDAILTQNKIRLENTMIMREKKKYVVVQYSVDVDKHGKQIGEFRDKPVFLTKGMFSNELKRVCFFLNKAKEYAEGENQKKYIEVLIEHLQTGDANKHLEASKYWVLDSSPTVETILGFIESYHDPAHKRTEFQCLVSSVDKNQGKLMDNFIAASASIQKLMPYPKVYERSEGVKLSYNNINTMIYATTMPFDGINLPNYDEIRNNFGFKNVSLTNMSNYGKEQKQDSDSTDPVNNATSVLIAAHELYGHGSGRLLMKEDVEGQKVPDILSDDPEKYVTTYWPEGVTYYDAFGEISSSYEECRADTTALYLMHYDEPLEIFGITEENDKKRSYVNVLSRLLFAGMNGLSQYNSTTMKWQNAYCQERFCILRSVMKWAGEAISIQEEALTVKIDEEKLDLIHEAVKKLLIHLNFYKSTYQPDKAKEFYEEMTKVDGMWLSIKERISKSSTSVTKKSTRLLAGGIIKYDEKQKTFDIVTPFDDKTPKISNFVHSILDNVELARKIKL